jgi:hypothetical protein
MCPHTTYPRRHIRCSGVTASAIQAECAHTHTYARAHTPTHTSTHTHTHTHTSSEAPAREAREWRSAARLWAIRERSESGGEGARWIRQLRVKGGAQNGDGGGGRGGGEWRRQQLRAGGGRGSSQLRLKGGAQNGRVDRKGAVSDLSKDTDATPRKGDVVVKRRVFIDKAKGWRAEKSSPLPSTWQRCPPDSRYSVYLLYWCKSTNTDAAATR